MKGFQGIMRDAMTGRIKELADHLGKKYHLVAKYGQELNASGWPLPSHLLPDVCAFLGDDTPLKYLAGQIGLIVFRPSDNVKNGRGCRDVAELCRRFAGCLDCHSEILKDGIIAAEEAAEFKDQAFRLIEGILAVNKSIEIKSLNKRGPVARRPRTQNQKCNQKISRGGIAVKQKERAGSAAGRRNHAFGKHSS